MMNKLLAPIIIFNIGLSFYMAKLISGYPTHSDYGNAWLGFYGGSLFLWAFSLFLLIEFARLKKYSIHLWSPFAYAPIFAFCFSIIFSIHFSIPKEIPPPPTMLIPISGLAMLFVGLILEATYRNAPPSTRTIVRIITIGLATLLPLYVTTIWFGSY